MGGQKKKNITNKPSTPTFKRNEDKLACWGFFIKEGTHPFRKKLFNKKGEYPKRNGKGKYVNIIKEGKEINVPIHNLTTTTEYLPKSPVSTKR